MSEDQNQQPTDKLQIVERDGDVVRIVGAGPEVIARMLRSGGDLVLEGLSIDGAGRGSQGLKELRRLAREFGADQGAKRILIRGTPRTTGAKPGKIPREIVIDVV